MSTERNNYLRIPTFSRLSYEHHILVGGGGVDQASDLGSLKARPVGLDF